ncbi:hypothetical protein [Mycoavidus cysteinexigens]|uniref:hypothetical protein n=1 Tax=Mycoavidus cysteinexigens TaxID=1553431 RepID=UPI000F84875B|nr:hypothetical protein [Mycoavidus cysteinexigens]
MVNITCHSGRTINECFQEEQRLLRPIIAPFEGYVEQMMRVSNTSLVHVDRWNGRSPHFVEMTGYTNPLRKDDAYARWWICERCAPRTGRRGGQR